MVQQEPLVPWSFPGKLKFANHSKMSVLTQFVLIEISGETAIGFSVAGIVNLTLCARECGWLKAVQEQLPAAHRV